MLRGGAGAPAQGQRAPDLKGVSDRNQSEKLIGRTVAVDREDAVALEEDEYFIEDLIGLDVTDTDERPSAS